MVPIFQWTSTGLLLLFILIALAIPAIVTYFDDDEQHHLH